MDSLMHLQQQQSLDSLVREPTVHNPRSKHLKKNNAKCVSAPLQGACQAHSSIKERPFGMVTTVSQFRRCHHEEHNIDETRDSQSATADLLSLINKAVKTCSSSLSLTADKNNGQQLFANYVNYFCSTVVATVSLTKTNGGCKKSNHGMAMEHTQLGARWLWKIAKCNLPNRIWALRCPTVASLMQ